MNKRLWILFAVLVIAVLGSLIFFKKDSQASTDYIAKLNVSELLSAKDVAKARLTYQYEQDAKKNKDAKAPTDDDIAEEAKGEIPDHYRGSKDAKVVVIEYEDFACVHCAQLASTFEKITEDYKDNVLFIYRNFSLSYPNSIVSQSAGEAAYLLGGEEAYWKMHDLLFQDDSTWTGQAVPAERRKELLTDFAKQAGLDVGKFLSAIEKYRSNGILNKMERDRAMGVKAKVGGTPTWLINGEKPADLSDSAIRKALDEALAKTNDANAPK
jgi:protein-disulfide isomerase